VALQDKESSMAKKVAVPNLVGTTQDSAEATLTDAGLGVIKRFVAGEPAGTVYRQSPVKVAKGDVVTIDILRAPEAPVRVDLSAVTKSIGELKKTVAALEASLAALKASVADHKAPVAEIKTSVAENGASLAELKAAVAEIKTSVAQNGASIAEIKKTVADHHAEEAHRPSAQTVAATAPAKPEQPSATHRSPGTMPQSPLSTDKPAGDA
jgi:septal ring factor EnvC (AmiA/AmiB activator)